MLSQCKTTTSPQKLLARVSPKHRFDEQQQNLKHWPCPICFSDLSPQLE